MGSTIIGCGKVPPEAGSGQRRAEALVDTNDEWISTRTGIRSRHVAVEETATDLAGSRRLSLLVLLMAAGEDGEAIDPASIDLVIYATITPDVLVPSAAGLPRIAWVSRTPCVSNQNLTTGFIHWPHKP